MCVIVIDKEKDAQKKCDCISLFHYLLVIVYVKASRSIKITAEFVQYCNNFYYNHAVDGTFLPFNYGNNK